jgi:hypothetical protein
MVKQQRMLKRRKKKKKTRMERIDLLLTMTKMESTVTRK